MVSSGVFQGASESRFADNWLGLDTQFQASAGLIMVVGDISSAGVFLDEPQVSVPHAVHSASPVLGATDTAAINYRPASSDVDMIVNDADAPYSCLS